MTAPASTKYKVSKKAIKRYLADHDLTQKQLAQMAGITPGTLSALIRFQRDMRIGNLFALADAMRMDPRDLVEKVDE
jgi:transcriptional regulator with XRE-family HTH domain|nr:MAG TPA_asm: helix-turn-helix domain protein [Caudoviricetes sp.]